LQKLLLCLALLITDIGLGYPQTIVHGYQTCVTCHASIDGGDTLNNYGRAMTEEFMATFAREGEAREFFGLAESDSVDLGIEYRNLRVQDAKTGKSDQFPMYSVGQLVLRHAGLSVLGSVGYFGRDRVRETRQWWVNYNVSSDAHRLDIKYGYWLPVVGLGSNNHDLAIKKGQGFGRGQERFVSQIAYSNRWFEAKAMLARSDIRIEKGEDNFPKNSSESPEEILGQFLFRRIEGLEVGLHGRQTDGVNTLQGFSTRIAKKKVYIFLQQDLDPKKQIRTTYGRLGWFIIRGLDLYYEVDRFESKSQAIDRRAFGFNWMLRPRLEYEGGYSQWLGESAWQTSLKLWM
jgi:hypothetical protein